MTRAPIPQIPAERLIDIKLDAYLSAIRALNEAKDQVAQWLAMHREDVLPAWANYIEAVVASAPTLTEPIKSAEWLELASGGFEDE